MPFIILSDGREHWFWNCERADQRDVYDVYRILSLGESQFRQSLGALQVPPDGNAAAK